MAKRQFFNNPWKALIVVNLVLAVATLWLVYSQNAYVYQLVSTEKPVVIAEQAPSTAIVINPFTGYFILASSQTLIVGIIILVLIIALGLFYGPKLFGKR